MALADVLDVCFDKAHVPHIYDIIYRYVFDMELAMDNYGGIPCDIYARLTEEATVIKTGAYATMYTVNDKYHRLNGPAVVGYDGDLEYYVNDKLHRTDGPAITMADKFNAYFVDGKLHRLDGPAVTEGSGRKKYYIDDVRYSLSEFNAEVERRRMLVIKN